MPGSNLPFLKSRNARLLSLVLLAQVAGFYAVSRRENAPPTRPLDQLPARFDQWQLAREESIEKEILAVLKADDVVERTYVDPARNRAASLFVAFFKSQRSGQAPHSPKNCLPGSGWVPSASDVVSVTVPGRPDPIRVNRYVVSKGDDKSIVFYWYQSRNRVVASEYRAKFYLVADAIRYNRSDTALVRVVVPVFQNNAAKAAADGENFIRSFFPVLRAYLPS